MALRLEELIDIAQFQSLQDRLNEIYPFPSAIIDNDGVVHTATAWQDVCTKFHRQNKECEKECIKSDQYILEHLAEANPAVSYRCPHGLIDNAMPIVVDGRHLGNYFVGQFFLEPPDLEFFKQQALKYGFDQEAYLAAVRKVPIWTMENLNSYLHFLKGMIEVVSNVGLKSLKATEAARAIRDSEERHRTILQTAMDGFWLVNRQGCFLEVNEAYCQMSGYNTAELLAMRISDVEVLETPAETEKRMQKLIVEGEARFETKHRRKDGSVYDVEVSTRVPANGSDQIVASIRDITERKKAEEEKRRLQAQLSQTQKIEAVGRLAGGVAHDYNNTLGVILGYTELALRSLDPGAPVYPDLEEIYKAAKRSSDLTTQLLAFARKQTIAPKVLDLNASIEATLKMLRRLIGEQIDLAWLPGAALASVRMDPSQLDQLLANLCINARDAIDGPGKITIETEHVRVDDAYRVQHPESVPGDFVSLRVSDSGCGMDEETKSHMFEPFFTTKSASGGTGLGLATVHGIVMQNHGFISVASQPGAGTSVRVFLPSHGGKPDLIETGVPQEPVEAGNATVLLVEDEPALLVMCKRMLERLRYRVLTASTPDEAIHLARQHAGEIQLLITDVVMPEMNGRALAEKISSLCSNPKCLFMSGYTADVIAHQGVLDEGVNFIQKPFSMEDLAAKVRNALHGA